MQKMLREWLNKNPVFVFFLGLSGGIMMLMGCGPRNDAVAPPIQTGTFIDGPVAGLSYRTDSISGVTGEDGTFRYLEGQTVTFSAGEIVLGSAAGKAIMTPVDLVAGAKGASNMTSVNICRFLQTVDVDGNHANGIQMTEAIRALLTWENTDGANDGSIFHDDNAIFSSTGTVPFVTFMNRVRTALNDAGVFTAGTPRALKSASGARRLFSTTLAAAFPPVFSPYVKEVGIGVTSLAVSGPFYSNVLGLKYVSSQMKTDREESVYEDNRDSATHKVVLMQFKDASISCKNRPVKLVFAVPNVDALYASIKANGGAGFVDPSYPLGSPNKIAMAFDPDGYMLELMEYTYLSAPRLTGIGIGVDSIQAIDDFYTRVIGMRFNYYLPVPGFMNEMIMQSPLSSADYSTSYGMDMVLMNYFNPRVYTDVPAKIVFTLGDPAALAQAIASEGFTIIQMPTSSTRGVAKDPSGYEVEMIKSDN